MIRLPLFLVVSVLTVFGNTAVSQEKGPGEADPVERRLTLKGHDGEVRSAQFSPDGSVLATASMDGTLILWDPSAGTKLDTIQNAGQWWMRLTFTDDGKKLLAGTQRGSIKIVDTTSGKETGELKGHKGLISMIALVESGKTLVTVDGEGTVLFWDFARLQRLDDRSFKVGRTLAAAITSDAKTLISTGAFDDAGVIKIWDVATKKQTGTLRGHEGGILSLALSPDGKSLASSARGSVKLWNLEESKERATLAGHENDVFSLRITADGKTLVTGSIDQTVKLWDLATGGERSTLEGIRAADAVLAVAVSSDGKRIAAGRGDHTVTLWQLKQRASLVPAGKPKAARRKPRTPLPENERRAIQAEVERLAAEGKSGVEALAAKVREGDEDWKAAALIALRNLGPDAAPALNAIVPLIRSGDPDLRRLAISAAKTMGPKAKSALPALMEAAKETSDFNGSFSLGGPSNIAEAALEAVTTIDPDSRAKCAVAMLPGLLAVVEKGRSGPTENAFALLNQLGPHAKPALPRLVKLISGMPAKTAGRSLGVFLAAGEDGMAILADFILDPKTERDMKVAVMRQYHWDRRATPSSLRILRGLLEDESAQVRASALQTLRSVRAKELIPQMVKLMGDRDILKVPSEWKGDDAYYAARALGNQGKDAVPALREALKSDEPLVRFQAARALAEIGKEAKEAAPTLEKLLKDPVPLVGIEAARGILKAGGNTEAAAKLLEKHLTPDARLQGPALDAIQHLGPAADALFPAVKKLVLDSDDFPVQRTGLYALENMRPESKEVAAVWAKLVQKNPFFLTFPPSEAIRANRSEKEIEEIVPFVVKQLKARDVNTRRRATEVLKLLGPAAKPAMPALIAALDDDSFAAHGAMEALGAMGADAQPAVAVLVRKFEAIRPDARESDFEKREILTALEHIGPGAREAVPQLQKWLPDNPRAARVLAAIGPDAKAAVPTLEKLFAEGTNEAKCSAVLALVKITRKTDPYVGKLAEIVQRSKDPNSRANALEVLASIGADARPALPVFLAVLKERNPRQGPFGEPDLRYAAAQALVHFGADGKPAVPDLIDMVEHSYYVAQIAAAEALGAIGPDAKSAIPALEKMAEEDPRFKPIVAKALAKIREKTR